MMKKLMPVLLATVFALAMLFPALPASASAREGAGYIGAWQPSATGGFGVGNANMAAVPLAESGGKLYAGASNENGCQIWVKDAGNNWTRANNDGFGDSGNIAVSRMEEYGGKLYAAASSQTACSVWRYDGGKNWTNVSSGSPVQNTGNIGITSMESFNGKLYVGLMNIQLTSLPPTSAGGPVYSYDGSTWTSVNNPGFGSTENMAVSEMATYNGSLYAGTTKATISVDALDLQNWKITLASKGCELWKYSGSGTSWSKVSGNGISDLSNIAVSSMAVYGGSLFIGTTNGDGTAIVNVTTEQISDFNYASNGLYIYSYNGSRVFTEVKGGFDNPGDMSATSMAGMNFPSGELLIVGAGSTSGFGKLKAFDGSEWYNASDPGFGNSNNLVIASVCGFGGDFYVGTGNREQGCEIWYGSPPETGAQTFKTWYLAEGSTNGFETWVLVQNPGEVQANVQITYMTPAGETQGPPLVLEPESRTTIFVADTVPDEYSVSTMVTSDQPIIAERAMYWGNRIGGHDSIGVTPPSPIWYLAEGSTNGFETWVLLQNPGDQTVSAQLMFMTPAGMLDGPRVELGPRTRQTVNVADTVPNEYSVSTMVTANQPIIAERAMYWGNRTGGHDSIGVTSQSPLWYLAEGSTNGFESWVLIQNPGDKPANVQLTYMTPSGEVQGPPVVLDPQSRKTIFVADTVPDEYSVSTMVTSDQPIIAERAMYWGNRIGGHDSIGVERTSATWYLAEGSTNGFETWVLLQNPGDDNVTAKLTFMTPTGRREGPTVELEPRTRKTVNVAETVPNEYSVSTKVNATYPIIAERAMYWGNRVGGHDSIGTNL